MTKGKYISLGTYKNVKIGYGTVDYIDLKTVYLTLNGWIFPITDSDFNSSISKVRKKIKDKISTLNNDYFKPQSIVDLDIKSKRLKVEKKSLMDLEITLFVKNKFEIRKQSTREIISNLIKQIIDDELDNKELFNFNMRIKKTHI